MENKDIQQFPLVLRPNQVVKELGISLPTFYRMAKAGTIKTIKMSRTMTGVERSEIERYLASLRQA
jgi:excisionase family DNA binding protein